MSGKTKIKWTESSWNPVTGCSPVSAGCAHCYAARFAKRLKAMGNPRYTNGFDVTIHEDIKFISAEPLLSPLPNLDLQGIDWLIVGGESGPGNRPILEEWVMELKSKCEASDTAFFFKQWGGINKKRTGSLLDGKEYKNYPTH